MSVRIMIVDDHQIVREGLRTLIEKQNGMEVAGEAEDGRTAVRLAGELSPDVIIMDVTMPGMNGIEATHQITGEKPNIKVLALSMQTDRRFIMEMLRAGASGYLLKDCAFEELAQAIHAVKEGKTYLSPDIADMVIKDLVRQAPGTQFSIFSLLTRREREVLQLLAEGKSTKDIARQLEISVKTVETFRQRIMEKMEVDSIAELTKIAIREGLTTVDI